MRTTLDIADDVLLAAKEAARREKTSVGHALSELARKALMAVPTGKRRKSATSAEKLARFGIQVLPRGGHIVTNELVNRIREEEGI